MKTRKNMNCLNSANATKRKILLAFFLISASFFISVNFSFAGPKCDNAPEGGGECVVGKCSSVSQTYSFENNDCGLGKVCCKKTAGSAPSISRCVQYGNGTCLEGDKCPTGTRFSSEYTCTGEAQICCVPEVRVPQTQAQVQNGGVAPIAGTGNANGAYRNQEKIPGFGQTSSFPEYLKQVINFGFATIGIMAMFMLMIGAYQYLMAAGNIAKEDSAKTTISSAFSGLILGLVAFLLLRTINPDLVSFKLAALQGGLTGQSGTQTGSSTPSGTSTPVSSNANCSNLNPSLNSALNQADNGVPPALLAAFMQRECPAAMGNANACGQMNSQGLAGGPMQFTPGTWNGLGCSGSMYNRQDALNCAAKKIAQDSGGVYDDASIKKAAKKYCGACNDKNCGSDDYCEGILANYNVYKNCPI